MAVPRRAGASLHPQAARHGMRTRSALGTVNGKPGHGRSEHVAASFAARRRRSFAVLLLLCASHPSPIGAEGGVCLPVGNAGIAAKYRGDRGIESDASVIFVEKFDDGSLDQLGKRWDVTDPFTYCQSGQGSLLCSRHGQSRGQTSLWIRQRHRPLQPRATRSLSRSPSQQQLRSI